MPRTSPYLSRYERAKILGVRAEQISAGQVPLVNVSDQHSPLEIAEAELRAGTIPVRIRRSVPGGGTETVAAAALVNLFDSDLVAYTQPEHKEAEPLHLDVPSTFFS